MSLQNHSKFLLLSLYFMRSFPSSTIKLIFSCVLIVCVFVCVVDHGVNEGEPDIEQYCEQENEDQLRDPEPEGQDFPEGFEDGKFNPIP